MKIKQIEFAIKRGLPNFSSVSAGVTIELDTNDDPHEVFAKARNICEAEAQENGDKALDEAAEFAKGQARNQAIQRHFE